jgi:hypothetical protein
VLQAGDRGAKQQGAGQAAGIAQEDGGQWTLGSFRNGLNMNMNMMFIFFF